MLRNSTGRAAVAAALALAGAALAPAAATAADEVLSTTATTAALTEGRGTFAFGTAPGTLRIVAQGRAVDAAVPPECQPLQLAAIGGGQVALHCEVPQPQGARRTEPRLVDAATGELRVPAGIEHLVLAPNQQGGLRVAGVGSVGLSVMQIGPKYQLTRAVDWRSGAVLPVPGEERGDAAQIADLDSVAGVQTMCSPLQRTGGVSDTSLGFDAALYAEPHGLFQDRDSRQLELQRCGSSQRTAIGSAYATVMTLGSGLATANANTGDRGYTYVIACGLRLTWQAGVTAGHVDGAAILSGREAEGPWEIRRVPLNGACDSARKALRLDVRAAGKAVSAAPRAARWSEAALGATAKQVTGLAKAAPQLRLAAGGKATVASGRAATRVQWRTGGAWKSARRAGRGWTIAAPGLRSARTATVRATSPGASATFAVKLLPPRR